MERLAGVNHASSPQGLVSDCKKVSDLGTEFIVPKVSQIRPAMMYVSWKVVFHLPRRSAARTCPASMAIWRRPVTRNSRAIISAVTHTGQMPFAVRKTKAVQTSILSASGSSSFPRGVTRFIFLASQPSRKSVPAAMMKRMRAVRCAHVLSQATKAINPAARKRRERVIALGKFTWLVWGMK